MDTVLVIGGCGGLGHHIVKQLLEKKDASNVTVFDLKTERNVVSGARYIKGDLSSLDDIRNALQKVRPQVIIHTASPVPMGQKNTQRLYERVNIEGTRFLLETMSELKCVKAMVYTSSSSVIHNNLTDIINADETWPKCYLPEQTEFYTHTKAVAEDMILGVNRKDGLLTVVLRGSTLFGEGDNTTIPQMVGNARSGRSKMQVGDGKNLFDFTYIGNAAYAHILAAKALVATSVESAPPPNDKRIDGEAFVITNDEPWPFWGFVREVASAAGAPIQPSEVRVVPSVVFYIVAVLAEWAVWIISRGTRESQINRKMVKFLGMTRTFDITKAKERLGYRPQVGMKEAIKLSVDAFLLASSSEDKKGK
jgi:sterol-4alpha-carboxylate 3-dehydrogenase (decarboxylating)